jgi:MFS transporter, SP family, sugar:H+ symporter
MGVSTQFDPMMPAILTKSLFRPCAWVVTGEIFPLKVRAKSLSMTTASNWLLNWAIAYATPYMVDSGPGNANLQSKVFFIWGG